MKGESLMHFLLIYDTAADYLQRRGEGAANPVKAKMAR
jgi:hypothetical protein